MPAPDQPAPHLAVCDLVHLVGDESDATPLAVTQVRQYPDGSLRYSVAELGDPDDEVNRSAIYDADRLVPTGERVPLAHFHLGHGFEHRDIVRVSVTYDDADYAGRTGMIDGEQTDDRFPMSVWFPELGEGD